MRVKNDRRLLGQDIVALISTGSRLATRLLRIKSVSFGELDGNEEEGRWALVHYVFSSTVVKHRQTWQRGTWRTTLPR